MPTFRSRAELHAVWQELFGRPQPEKIVCVGLNYGAHSAEQDVEAPSRPLLFAKWPNALAGADDPILLPAISSQVDFEAELGVVIGEHGAVWGYTCLNDVSARDVQFADGQWVRGKSFDSFCPIGPELVPAADVGDPQRLAIRAVLNGKVMQDASTADMIFSVAEIVAFVQQAITLAPGDLIATGTPEGVGAFHDPPVYLQDGDEITIEIERVGTLNSRVVALPREA
ncbi:MAG TPA: fumarylacetoacetate hydrolase family protein [Gaiellaceae bacterium]|nr:fumarylacetoacetate hydrolase family protein [Gaiellaceae bacterium]